GVRISHHPPCMKGTALGAAASLSSKVMLAHEILVLRHGETEWNLAGRLQGTLDSRLTPKGRRQALDQGAILTAYSRGPFTWYCSPQGRARATAALARTNQVIFEDARLSEIDLGDWTGMTRGEVAASMPHLFAANMPLAWYDHAPAGEGFSRLRDRCAAFLEALSGPAVIITHGITGRFLRCLALGRSVTEFSTMQDEQGVVFRIQDGKQQKLTLHGTFDLG
ncbi:MAG: histidine phosphatase family protein, partial [Pseudomonadota bacterium]